MSLPSPHPDEFVLVTGASAGIGAELARLLAGHGHDLVLVARRRERLEGLAEELRLAHGTRVDVRPCDLADDAARRGLIEELLADERAVAGVCNNAGFGMFGPFAATDLPREQEMVRLNVLALHELTGAFLPAMVERGAGAVLNVASLAAFQPIPGNATYAATKAFVVAFSEAVHAELGGTGVSVTALCPGPVETEFAAVAGVDDLGGQLPRQVWASAAHVAKAGVEAMTAGRRSAYPSVVARATALSGRLAPRSAFLPLVAKLGGRVFDDR